MSECVCAPHARVQEREGEIEGERKGERKGEVSIVCGWVWAVGIQECCHQLAWNR